MKVKLKFFALFRDIVGAKEMDKEVKSGSRVQSLLEELFERYPELKKYSDEILVSINRNYASEDAQLKEGDEVALMPPVSGG
ncbi:MAG: MoaD/ThiS family protein [Thermoplasmata archaeon]|nr:MoaD/ThiS family protein [Thermoplasmata archaeon]